MQLIELNQLSPSQLKEELTKCCGSSAWVEKIASLFPFDTTESLLQQAHDVWNRLTQKDWLEAFQQHPKIGDVNSLTEKFASTAKWASGEQASVHQASQKTIEKLAEGNRQYEAKFGYIFIVCATGKSAEEMLKILLSRLPNEPGMEIKIAAAEQAKITLIRLEKLLL
jgi:2-oxo-4-hydroxy-4-carboxy-5-ureidoimidazoline decarboxylase